MKQLPLIFFINAASAIFHTNDCHTVFLSQRYHHFRPLIAKLDSITNQVTDYRFNHINISTNSYICNRYILHNLNILQAGYHCKDLTYPLYNFYHIDILINHLQFANLAFRPFQQIIK